MSSFYFIVFTILSLLGVVAIYKILDDENSKLARKYFIIAIAVIYFLTLVVNSIMIWVLNNKCSYVFWF